jgi:hypothetical protein
MGIQFDPMPASTELQLKDFVAALAQAESQARQREQSARFVQPDIVHVEVSRPHLLALWHAGLRVGALAAGGAAPPLRTHVKVRIGPLKLRAEVVFIDPQGSCGLQLLDLEGDKRVALERYLNESLSGIPYRENTSVTAPVMVSFGLAQRLLNGLAQNDPFAALGLPPGTRAEHLDNHLAELRRVLADDPADATPPQLARVQSARRAIGRLEALLAPHIGAQRELIKQAPPSEAPRTPTTAPLAERVRELVAHARRRAQEGHAAEARRLTLRALEKLPGDPEAEQLLKDIDRLAAVGPANELLDKAEVFAQGLGMTRSAIGMACEAARLCAAKPVRLRAIAVLHKAKANAEALSVAEHLLASHPHDPQVLLVLLELYESTDAWSRALKAGEALLRLQPNDGALAKRVKKAAAKARH